MEELKVHIWYVMFWKFKNNKNATKSAKKIPSAYGQSVITDHQIWNWFSKICPVDMSLIDETREVYSSDLGQRCPHGAMVKALDCGIVVRDFKL